MDPNHLQETSPQGQPMREIINGIFYVMRSGCPWRLLPSDLPPWSTVYRWFAKFRDKKCFEKINHALAMFDREFGAALTMVDHIAEARLIQLQASIEASSKVGGRQFWSRIERELER